MFNIETYYTKVQSGEKIDNRELLEYVCSFDKVVIWGGSYLGDAVGKYFLDHNVEITCYWDMRANELEYVNGIEVIKPFPETDYDQRDVLVILCIGNTAIMPNLLARLKENEYENVLRGDKLFMGTICRFDKDTGINGELCNGTMTCRSMFCSKLHNIVKHKYDKGGLFLDNLTIMITTKCSLRCKYCVAYMNSYPNDKRYHVSYKQICEDIDHIFEAVDSIGSITIQGGEPFLHPDIDRIVKKLLEKRNFGVVSIATNGIYVIEKEKLEIFRDNRLNVAFSGYYKALQEPQMNQFYKNIELMKSENIPHTVGVQMPEWTIPPTLWDRKYSEENMTAKKSSCRMPERCVQILNGKLYPCLYSVSLHGIGVADYKDDYVDLTQDNLSEAIREFIEKPYYRSCGHCGGGGGSTDMAGEQGFCDFITERTDE